MDQIKTALAALSKQFTPQNLIQEHAHTTLQTLGEYWRSQADIYQAVSQWLSSILVAVSITDANDIPLKTLDLLIAFIQHGIAQDDKKFTCQALQVYANTFQLVLSRACLNQSTEMHALYDKWTEIKAVAMEAFALLFDDRQQMQDMPQHAAVSVRLMSIKCTQLVISSQLKWQDEKTENTEHAFIEFEQLAQEAQEMLELLERHLGLVARTETPNAVLSSALVFALTLVASSTPSAELADRLADQLLELVQRKHSGSRQHAYLNKQMKNAVCHLLRQRDLSAASSYRIIDYLGTLQGNAIRASIHQFGQLMRQRGHKRPVVNKDVVAVEDDDYEALLEQEMLETTVTTFTQLTTEQKAGAVTSVLQEYAQDPQHPILGTQQPVYGVKQIPFDLPPNFDARSMGLDLMSQVVLASLFSFGAGAEDGGVQLWRQTMDKLRDDTTRALSAVGERERERAKGVAVVKRKPFRLDVSPLQPHIDLKEIMTGTSKIDAEKSHELRQSVLVSIKSIVSHLLDHSVYGQKLHELKDVEETDADAMDEDTQVELDALNEELKERRNKSLELSLSLLDTHGASWMYEQSANRNAKRHLDGDAMDVDGKDDKRQKHDENVDMSQSLVSQVQTQELAVVNTQQVSSAASFRGSRTYWSLFLSRFIVYYSMPWFAGADGAKKFIAKKKPTKAELAALDSELIQVGEMMSTIRKSEWIEFLLDDFANRWDLAVRWLLEEYYRSRGTKTYFDSFHELMNQLVKLADEAVGNVNTMTFIPWMPQHGHNVIFMKFLASLPVLPSDLLQGDSGEKSHLATWCQLPFANSSLPTPLERFKVQLGLDAAAEIVARRRDAKLVEAGTTLLLQACAAPEKARRADAVRIVRRWWTQLSATDASAEVSQSIPQMKLDQLVDSTVKFAAASVQKLVNAEKCADDDSAMRWLDLYVILCVRDPGMFSHLLELYPRIHMPEEFPMRLKNTILGAVSKIVGFIGMPKDVDASSYKLLTCIEQCSHDDSIDLKLCIAKAMLQSTELRAPNTLFVDMFWRLAIEQPEQYAHPEFWICKLGGERLRRQEVFQGLVTLADHLLNEQDAAKLETNRQLLCSTISRICAKHPDPESRPSPINSNDKLIHPVDIAVMFHCLDVEPVAEAPKLSLKKNMEVTNMICNHPALQSIYTPKLLCFTFVAVLDRHQQSVIPVLLMRSVMATLLTYKQQVADFILTYVLTRAVSFKCLWAGAKFDRRNATLSQPAAEITDDQRSSKAFWEGWVRLLKLLAPESFDLLVRIPSKQMKQILGKCGFEVQQQFSQWLIARMQNTQSSKSFTNATSIVTELLAAHVAQQEVQTEA